jgi:hypothetical protein
MLLDVILKEPDLVWLATSEEKMTHVSAFTAIPKDSLPQTTTPQGSYEPVRYFPDQVPIGIHPDGRWILVCLLTQDAKRELRTFLERHLMFLTALPTWTLRVVIPAHMTAHGMRFVDEARRNLRWRFDGQFRDDLRWYFETRRAGGNPDAVSDDDERAHRARLRRFSGLGFSALYALWVARGDDMFPTVAAQVGDALFREAGIIEPLVLPHAYSHLAPLVGVA